MRRNDHRPDAMLSHGGRFAGVLVRGYVVKVHPPGSGPPVPDPIPGWLADVHVIEPGWRGLLHWVPLATQSGGVYDIEHYQPRAAGKKLGGGALQPEGGPTATPPNLSDGDLVIVAFLGGDAGRPVILAQLPHPAAVEAPTGYRWWRTAGGATFGVVEDGNVEMGLPAGKTLTVTTSDGATIQVADGNVIVTGAKLTARTADVSLNVQRVLLDAVLIDIATVLVEWLPLITLGAAIFGIPLTQSTTIVPLLAAGAAGSQGKSYKAVSTESD